MQHRAAGVGRGTRRRFRHAPLRPLQQSDSVIGDLFSKRRQGDEQRDQHRECHPSAIRFEPCPSADSGSRVDKKLTDGPSDRNPRLRSPSSMDRLRCPSGSLDSAFGSGQNTRTKSHVERVLTIIDVQKNRRCLSFRHRVTYTVRLLLACAVAASGWIAIESPVAARNASSCCCCCKSCGGAGCCCNRPTRPAAPAEEHPDDSSEKCSASPAPCGQPAIPGTSTNGSTTRDVTAVLAASHAHVASSRPFPPDPTVPRPILRTSLLDRPPRSAAG